MNDLQAIPIPLRDEPFTLLKRGVFDDPAIDVYLNAGSDFAFLAPPPVVDYRNYEPRHKALGLTKYKNPQRVIESRHAKIKGCFETAASVLEVGAADGAFLAHLNAKHPGLALAAIEPDESTRSQRDAIPGLRQFATLDDAAKAGLRVDVVCLFHVFEHLADPGAWLTSARRLLAPGGQFVVEVPSLDDPLFSLYKSAAHREFYFQKQHPFVYSGASLRRVLQHHGFAVNIIPYQRYGMENHLAWLASGKPGGNAEFGKVFESCDAPYKAALESRGLTDTVFAVAAEMNAQ
jgi:SAM-dependent methyltransferase